MPSQYCRRCDKWYPKRSARQACRDCNEQLIVPSRDSDAQRVQKIHAPLPRSPTDLTVPYCLIHHTLGHWEGGDCLKKWAKKNITIPSLKLHWDMTPEMVEDLTKSGTPGTIREVMAHLSKLSHGTTRAREIFLSRDKLLKQIQRVLSKKLDDSELQTWKFIMAKAAYSTHSFLCKLLGVIHSAREELFEFYIIGRMTAHGVFAEWKLAVSHFAVAQYLNDLPDESLPAVDRGKFIRLVREVSALANQLRNDQENIGLSIEQAIAERPGVAGSFAMRELFRAPLRCMPSPLPQVLRNFAGLHVMTWPDMAHLKHHLELEMQHGDLAKCPDVKAK